MEKYIVNVPKIAEMSDVEDVEAFVDKVRAENSGAVFRVSARGQDPVETVEPVEIGEAVRRWLGESADHGVVESVTIEEVLKPSAFFALSIALEPGASGPVIRGARILDAPDEEEEKEEEAATEPGEAADDLERSSSPSLPRGKEVHDTVDIMSGPSEAQTYHLAQGMGFKDVNVAAAQAQIEFLYYMFIGCDALRLETTTLAEVEARSASDAARGEEEVACVEVTLELDEAAIFRQRDLVSRSHDPDDDAYAGAKEAREAGLGFVPGTGPIGVITNGAGLTMATMDLLAAYEVAPGPILDVGRAGLTESVPEAVASAVRILRADPNVKVLLVNVFGGSTRCDEVAQGLVRADDEAFLDLPVVVRIDGNRSSEADSALEASPVLETPADGLADAVARAVEALAERSDDQASEQPSN